MDHEVENAKEWQGDTTSRPVQRTLVHHLPSKPVGLPVRNVGTAGLGYRADEQNAVNDWNRYALSHDNAGTTAWRQRRRPNDFFKLPLDYGLIYETLHETSSRKPQSRQPTSSEDGQSFQDVLGQIGQSTGAFIELPAGSAAKELRIWGNPTEVARAKARLKEFVDKVETAYLDWVKIHRPSKKKRKDLQKKMAEEWEKQNFRQNPPEDASFPFQGVFIWPSGYPMTILLGSSLEAWDPLRTQHRCYITFDAAKSTVRVFGEQQEHVDLALDRIRITHREICVRSDPPAKIYLMEPPDAQTVQRSVALVPYKVFNKAAMASGPQRAPIVVPFMVGPPPSPDERRDWLACHPRYGTANRKCIERAIHVILQRVRFFRGHISMRVHFGFFCLGAYKKPGDASYTLEEYHNMLGNDQTVGELIRDLKREADLDDIIASNAKAASLLAPKDYTITSLADVKCQYSASFNVQAAGSSLSSRLEVVFATEGNGKYVVSTCKWFKRGKIGGSADGKPDLQSARVPLSIVCSDPKRGSAWEISISCRSTLDKSQVSKAMDEFARSIVLNMHKSAAAKEKSASICYKTNGLKVESWTLRTTRCYVLKGSSYILEVAKERMTRPSLLGTANHVQTRWTANMHSHEWEGMWTRQPYLLIGERGDWEPKVEDFFRFQSMGGGGGPSTDKDGFKEFLNTVKAVSHMLGPDLKSTIPDPTTFAITSTALIKTQAQGKAGQSAHGVQSGAKQPEREASQAHRLTHFGPLVKKGQSSVKTQALQNYINGGYKQLEWNGPIVGPKVVVVNGKNVPVQKGRYRVATRYGMPGWSGPSPIVTRSQALQLYNNSSNGQPGPNSSNGGSNDDSNGGSNGALTVIASSGLNTHDDDIASNRSSGPSDTDVVSNVGSANGYNNQDHETANGAQNALHAAHGTNVPVYRFGQVPGGGAKHARTRSVSPDVPKPSALTARTTPPSVQVQKSVYGNSGVTPPKTTRTQSHLQTLLVGNGSVGHGVSSAKTHSVLRHKWVEKSTKGSDESAQSTDSEPRKDFGCVEGNLIEI